MRARGRQVCARHGGSRDRLTKSEPLGFSSNASSQSRWSPRFCVDCPTTVNKNPIRKPWPMPEMASHINTVAGAKYITVCDVQSAYHQLPITHKAEQYKTAFLCDKEWKMGCLKRLPFGIANALFLFQRIMALALAHVGPKSGLLVHMDDTSCCSSTWEGHLSFLENTFKALQAA